LVVDLSLTIAYTRNFLAPPVAIFLNSPESPMSQLIKNQKNNGMRETIEEIAQFRQSVSSSYPAAG